MSEHPLFPVSSGELERRWGAIRELMTRRGVDALVLQGSNDWLGGYVKWFTDIPATNAYPRTVIFPLEGGMTVVEQGPFGGERALGMSDPVHRGVERILFTPSYAAIGYTGSYDADLIVRELEGAGYGTVGLVATSAMYHDFGVRLAEARGIAFVDATDGIDAIKAIKSAEEQRLIRRTAALQDEVIAAVAGHIRPGLKDADVAAFARYSAALGGSEQGIVLGTSAPLGRASVFRPLHLQGRELAAGDHLTLLLEVNGPGGQYAEIARTFVLGSATQELADATAAMVEAQAATLARLVPGAGSSDIAAHHDAYMQAAGLPPETRLYCHGQGYDMVERPLIRRDETMPIAAGMNIVVHPGVENERVWVTICDNYLIGPDGAGECLHATPKRVIEV